MKIALEDYPELKSPAGLSKDIPVGVGSLVRLNGGGPLMTVVDVGVGLGHEEIVVGWRDRDGTQHEQTLPRAAVYRSIGGW